MSLLLGLLLAVFGGGPPILVEGEGDPATEEVLQERSPQKARTLQKVALSLQQPDADRPGPSRSEARPLKSRLDSWIARRWFRSPS